MRSDRTFNVRSVAVPRLMYGTAWKEDRTQALVLKAIATGFRAFDTANQRKHYVEEEVGAAVRSAIGSGTSYKQQIFFFRQSLHISGARITASHMILIAISPRKCASLSLAPLSTSV